MRVALLAEGVDRNFCPSSRPAPAPVALLAEGVDRNQLCYGFDAQMIESPSSRRAWIEISMLGLSSAFLCVALLAEGVDRNPLLRGKSYPTWVALLAEGVDRNQRIRFGVKK